MEEIKEHMKLFNEECISININFGNKSIRSLDYF